MNLHVIGGVAAVLLAATAGLIVQGGQLREERAKVATLKVEVHQATQRAEAAETAAARAEAEGATQAEEAAIVCQGEGAELFNAGRRTGIAIGLSRCPVS